MRHRELNSQTRKKNIMIFQASGNHCGTIGYHRPIPQADRADRPERTTTLVPDPGGGEV